jgi:hypothetical protein
MRDLILARIQTIKKDEGGFRKENGRWKPIECKDQHLSEVDFEQLTNVELLEIFERIILRLSRQM